MSRHVRDCETVEISSACAARCVKVDGTSLKRASLGLGARYEYDDGPTRPSTVPAGLPATRRRSRYLTMWHRTYLVGTYSYSTLVRPGRCIDGPPSLSRVGHGHVLHCAASSWEKDERGEETCEMRWSWNTIRSGTNEYQSTRTHQRGNVCRSAED